MQQYIDYIQANTGQAVYEATVTILTYPNGDLATLYTDDTQTTTVPNPLISDQNGRVCAYIPNGRYSRVVEGEGIDTRYEYDSILMYDPTQNTFTGPNTFYGQSTFRDTGYPITKFIHTTGAYPGIELAAETRVSTYYSGAEIDFKAPGMNGSSGYFAWIQVESTAAAGYPGKFLFATTRSDGLPNQYGYQFQIDHTDGATRRVTVTGSNGGNPTIGTTAGSLNLAPAVLCPTSLAVGGALRAGTGFTVVDSASFDVPNGALGWQVYSTTDAAVQVRAATNSGGGSITIGVSTAPPAGGSTLAALKFGNSTTFGIYYGSGAPSITVGKGSLYLRTDGTTTNDRAYIATDSSGSWTALITAT